MSWLYARSSTWRRVVQGTQTPLRMLGFTTLVLGGATRWDAGRRAALRAARVAVGEATLAGTATLLTAAAGD